METELFASVEAGDFDKFKELIKKETKETIDQVDFYGYTALHAAGEKGRTEMIPMLLGKTKQEIPIKLQICMICILNIDLW